MDEIRPGVVGQATQLVTEGLTATAYGSGFVSAFATPALVALMESASVDAIQKYMLPGQTSVGIEVNVKHLAATPIGLNVRAQAQVTSVEGRRVTFNVQAWDERELIGEGTHARMIVDQARFNEKIRGKQ